MKNIYLKETDYNKIKAVETFPNPRVKIGKYNGKLCRLHIAPKIKVSKPSLESLQWHGLKEGSYILTSDDGFFPSTLLFTVQNRLFVDGLNIGANNGRNLGTSSIGVIDLKTAVKILTENNCEIYE